VQATLVAARWLLRDPQPLCNLPQMKRAFGNASGPSRRTHGSRAGANAPPGGEHNSSVGPFEPAVAAHQHPVGGHDWLVGLHRLPAGVPRETRGRQRAAHWPRRNLRWGPRAARTYKCVYVQSDAEIGLKSSEKRRHGFTACRCGEDQSGTAQRGFSNRCERPDPGDYLEATETTGRNLPFPLLSVCSC
jgi:hypothetical protein